MNPTNTPFMVQTVGARRRGPRRTIFIAYQTWKNQDLVKKKQKKNEATMSSCFFTKTRLWFNGARDIDRNRSKFEAFFNQRKSFAFDEPTKEPKILISL